jgi:uncharacterized repeat protein (TIGR03803 family)
MQVTRCVIGVFASVLAAMPASAQPRFEVLHAFDATAAPLSGNTPSAPPVVWIGGLYGTTIAGGEFNRGIVYRLSSSGLTPIHSFNGEDGAYPMGALTVGLDGRLYGTTLAGGTEDRGTIFRISIAGEFETIHSFTSMEGRNPLAGVILASDGHFWGTTAFGGSQDAGTAFRISHAGTFTQVRSFADTFATAHLTWPSARLIQASDGNFYGSTYGSTPGSGGSVFSLTPGGVLSSVTTFSVFAVPPEVAPRMAAGVVEGPDGWLYGAACCGMTGDFGGPMKALFRVDKTGTQYQDLYGSMRQDPFNVISSLVLGSDGALYGGATRGTLFSIDGAGTLTIYKEMTWEVDGRVVSGLQAIAPGWFIGTAYYGGPGDGGTIFLFRPY